MHGTVIDINMHIADMQDGVTVEGRRQSGQFNIIMLDFYPHSVLTAAPVKPRQSQAVANNGMDRVPVLDMKKIQSTAENASFVVIFNPQTKARMHAPESLFELFNYRVFIGIDDGVSHN